MDSFLDTVTSWSIDIVPRTLFHSFWYSCCRPTQNSTTGNVSILKLLSFLSDWWRSVIKLHLNFTKIVLLKNNIIPQLLVVPNLKFNLGRQLNQQRENKAYRLGYFLDPIFTNPDIHQNASYEVEVRLDCQRQTLAKPSNGDPVNLIFIRPRTPVPRHR